MGNRSIWPEECGRLTAWIVLLLPLIAAFLAIVPRYAKAAWTGPVEVSAAGVSAASPAVAVDGADNTTVVWESGTTPNRQIRSNFRPAGGPWDTSSFTRIAASQDCFDPELAVNPAGAAVVVADCGSGAASMYAAYRPAGGSWQGAIAIPGSGNGDGPRVGIDDAGNSIAVWHTSADTIQSAYRPAAGPWAAGGQVSPAGDVAVDPDVAMSPTGRAVAVWRHRLTAPVATVESTDRVGAGAWGSSPTTLTRPAPTSTHPATVEGPEIDINALGSRLAVWTEDPDNTIGDDAPIRLTSGHGVATGWTGYANTGRTTDNVRNAEAPEVALDDQGRAVATWRGFDPVAGTFRAQASTTPSLGGAWISPVTLADTEIGGSGKPQVAVDPDGDATVMWQNVGGAISAVSRPAGGAFGPALTVSTTGFSVPDLTMNATGDTIATWISQATSPVRTIVNVDDVTPPALSTIDVPASVTAGGTVNVSAGASDVWSAPATLSWDFGEGSTATGDTATHTYATPGTRTITVTATDAVGNVATQTRQIEVTNGGTGALTLGVTIPKQSWRKIRKAGGIKVLCTLDAQGRCEAKATVAAKVAKRLGLKPGKLAGTGTGEITAAGGTATLIVKLTRKAKAAIGRARKSVKLGFEVTGSAAGRDSATLTRKLKIKR